MDRVVSAFEAIADDFLQAFDLYVFKYNAAHKADRPRLTAEHYSRLDAINERAARAGVEVEAAMTWALDRVGPFGVEGVS